ncbi:Linearmycin resistance ATP-binding protein LnrL [Eubacterium callanderi]|uniref:ABC transporter ATP-binding protein n=1 Tax=Eubacterium callanderi TaxID=53442 RepID=UPI0029FF2AEB|nr:ABC transporter ATP-binding protein [Eubacterium callanderi]WPK70006.1 Linearmycin resistance ATP-binding protein LnrL [Eubacterium callanderi]WPK74304.1 Linearmycin resistance ATP-binding protein LnrL [Eubacterium callanderi]
MEKVLQVQNLSKSYGSVAAVSGLSLSVARGEVFGLLGPNGAGKSTSIECMLGVKKASAGTVEILGINPSEGRKTLFERVGVQFQETGYQDKIRVEEVCRMTAALYRKPADWQRLLAVFDIQGLGKQEVSQLSGGERQRLSVLLALIPNPELVFLDELTTGLDTRARREVWQYLKELKKGGLTIVLTSHFMDEVKVLCDRVLILKKGEPQICGTIEEITEGSPCSCFEEAYLWYTGGDDDACV